MPKIISCTELLTLMDKQFPLIDVRTPGEFDQGHIPGANNIPLFSDAERAVVGTKYKQENKESALLKGLEYVGPKLAKFIKQLNRITKKKEVLVHCWRGGQRSASMAWLFELAGYQTYLLEGGYKAYRNYLLEYFARPFKLVVVGGLTGSGKSELLTEMAKNGEQVVDLEGLAHHKGSAFGAIGQIKQPSQQQFENDLFDTWRHLDTAHSIWLEDESASIGHVSIPSPLFQQIRKSKVIKVEVAKADRIERLVSEYTVSESDELKAAVRKIEKRLGHQSMEMCIEFIESKEYAKAATLILDYYDKAYAKGLAKRDPATVYTFEMNNNGLNAHAIKLIKFAHKVHVSD